MTQFPEHSVLPSSLLHPGCSVCSKEWTPEANSALQMCSTGAEGARCVLCRHPHSPALGGLIFSSLLWLHLSAPQAGPLCGTAVALTFTILAKRRAPAAHGDGALPWDGPQLASQGSRVGNGQPSPPGWNLLMGPGLWMWARMPACAFCQGRNTWLWGSPQAPKLRPTIGYSAGP